MLSAVAVKSRTFSSFSYSADEQGAGAGREHSQAGQWKYCIPWSLLSLRTGVAVERKRSALLGFPDFLAWSSNISQAVNCSSGGEKNWIVHSVFCIFIIILIINSIIISDCFVVSLNCLSLNTRVSPFVHFSSPSRCGGRGGGSEWLSGADLPAAKLNYDT